MMPVLIMKMNMRFLNGIFLLYKYPTVQRRFSFFAPINSRGTTITKYMMIEIMYNFK